MKPRPDKDRCPVSWNPGEWPYTTRCNLKPRHGAKTEDPVHVDHRGRTLNGVTGERINPPKADQEVEGARDD